MNSLNENSGANDPEIFGCFRPVVVIPAFQESASIASIVSDCRGKGLAVIVVDDGSTDTTAEDALRAGADVVRLPMNQGKGVAIACGIRQARAIGATHVATLDGDGQHCPSDLCRLLNVARDQPATLFVGARRSARHDVPLGRRVANTIADFWIGWAVGTRMLDSQSGLRIYPPALLPALTRLTEHRFAWETDALLAAGKHSIAIAFLDVPARYKDGRRPSHFRPVADITRIILVVGAYLLRRRMHLRGLWRSLRW